MERDIVRWGEIKFHEAPVGNNGADYAKREIHIYMPTLHGLPVVVTSRQKLGKGLTWSARVEYLPLMEDVINAVANDPFGIGLVGWFPTDEGWDRSQELMKQVRLLPISDKSPSIKSSVTQSENAHRPSMRRPVGVKSYLWLSKFISDVFLRPDSR